MPADALTLVFREWGRANGFRRKGVTLYRDQPETVAVVNLQASQYGGRYYLNIALWLKAVGEEPDPKEYHCQLRTRLSALRGSNTIDVEEAFLDLRSKVSNEARIGQFRQVLDSVVGPALSKTGTLADLKANPTLVGRFLVNKDAHRLLGVPGLGMSSA